MVVIFPDRGNEALAAVIEKVDGQPFDNAVLRRELLAKIEPYAVPQRIRVIDRLPRNDNDKVDRQATIDWFHQQ